MTEFLKVALLFVHPANRIPRPALPGGENNMLLIISCWRPRLWIFVWSGTNIAAKLPFNYWLSLGASGAGERYAAVLRASEAVWQPGESVFKDDIEPSTSGIVCQYISWHCRFWTNLFLFQSLCFVMPVSAIGCTMGFCVSLLLLSRNIIIIWLIHIRFINGNVECYYRTRIDSIVVWTAERTGDRLLPTKVYHLMMLTQIYR